MSDQNDKQTQPSQSGKPAQTSSDCDLPDEICMALIVIGLAAIGIYYIGYGIYWLGLQLYRIAIWPFRTRRGGAERVAS